MNVTFKKSSIFLACAALHSGTYLEAQAGGHKIAAGAFTVRGGSNPVSFANPLEYSYTYINNAGDREILISLIPGLGYAFRFEPSKDVAISLGGTLAVATAPFVGIYGGFAWSFWCPVNSFCMSLDYRTSAAPYSQYRKVMTVSSVSLWGILCSQ